MRKDEQIISELSNLKVSLLRLRDLSRKLTKDIKEMKKTPKEYWSAYTAEEDIVALRLTAIHVLQIQYINDVKLEVERALVIVKLE